MAVKDKVIITCAVTGASPAANREFQGNEQVANAALEAGRQAPRSRHVRKPDGRP